MVASMCHLQGLDRPVLAEKCGDRRPVERIDHQPSRVTRAGIVVSTESWDNVSGLAGRVALTHG